ERGAGAGNLDPHFYLVVPDVDGTFLNCSHFRASALSWVQFKVRRRPCGRRRAWDANCDRGAGLLGRPFHHRLRDAAARAGSFSFSRSGHQWFSHWSSHISLRCGLTSRANISMFFRVSSCGIEPMWSSTIRLPTRSFLTASRNWSATVLGLPPITKPLSRKSLYFQFGTCAINSSCSGLRFLTLLARLR